MESRLLALEKDRAACAAADTRTQDGSVPEHVMTEGAARAGGNNRARKAERSAAENPPGERPDPGLQLSPRKLCNKIRSSCHGKRDGTCDWEL
ncbi:hypothetical protein AOLI_G00065460 [Acnodon oligacanthus]